jgi:hypothetical protein
MITLEFGGLTIHMFLCSSRWIRVAEGGAKIPKWPEKESTTDTVKCK